MEIKTQPMIADNPKHQSKLNKALSWLIKYNGFNTKRDLVSDSLEEIYTREQDSKEWRSINKKCENAFDKYLDYASELPKYQIKKIEKSLYY